MKLRSGESSKAASRSNSGTTVSNNASPGQSPSKPASRVASDEDVPEVWVDVSPDSQHSIGGDVPASRVTRSSTACAGGQDPEGAAADNDDDLADDAKPAPESRPKHDLSKEWEVEAILAKGVNDDGITVYLLKWVGFGDHENTWEPLENLTNCKDLLAKFEKELKKQDTKKQEEDARKRRLEADASAEDNLEDDDEAVIRKRRKRD